MRLITDIFEYCAQEIPYGTQYQSQVTTSEKQAQLPFKKLHLL